MVTFFVHTQTLLKRKYINSLGSVTLTDQPVIGVGLDVDVTEPLVAQIHHL